MIALPTLSGSVCDGSVGEIAVVVTEESVGNRVATIAIKRCTGCRWQEMVSCSLYFLFQDVAVAVFIAGDGQSDLTVWRRIDGVLRY